MLDQFIGLGQWVSGVGLPSLAAAACFAGAAFAWFRLPIAGHYVGAALLVVGVTLVARASGYAEARADCQSAQLRQSVESLEKNLEAVQGMMSEAAAIQARERKSVEEARASFDDQKAIAHEILEELRKAPTPVACRHTPDERRRLQSIRVGTPRPATANPAGR